MWLSKKLFHGIIYRVPVKPVLVVQFEYVEWTPEGHLRHSRFMGLREDEKARDVVREA